MPRACDASNSNDLATHVRSLISRARNSRPALKAVQAFRCSACGTPIHNSYKGAACEGCPSHLQHAALESASFPRGQPDLTVLAVPRSTGFACKKQNWAYQMYVRKLMMFAAASAMMTLISCSPAETPPTQVAEETPTLEQRTSDLLIINDSLQRYHQANGSYPVSDRAQGFASNWGASLGDIWIPGLDLQPLPRDPARSSAGDGPQYLYISDGTDYKLIAHSTGDCGPEAVTQSIQIDPRRQNDERCWAYGVWSAGGAEF